MKAIQKSTSLSDTTQFRQIMETMSLRTNESSYKCIILHHKG